MAEHGAIWVFTEGLCVCVCVKCVMLLNRVIKPLLPSPRADISVEARKRKPYSGNEKSNINQI